MEFWGCAPPPTAHCQYVRIRQSFLILTWRVAGASCGAISLAIMAFHKDINPDTPQERLKCFLAQVVELAGKDLGMDLSKGVRCTTHRCIVYMACLTGRRVCVASSLWRWARKAPKRAGCGLRMARKPCGE